MARQGLMDDCGYDPECSHMEECQQEAYRKGYDDAIDEFVSEVYRIFTSLELQGLYLTTYNIVKQRIAYVEEQLKEQK